MSGTHAGSVTSPFRQPKAVFAVAFACVVSFMGIGLVDPILPAISHELHASPSEVTLLFTSYLVVTAVAMLITNWVSSRIGLAPYAAGRMVLAAGIHFPFYIAVGALLFGIGVLATAHRLLNQAERIQAEQVTGSPASPGPASTGPVGAPGAGLGVVEDQAEGVPVS